MKWLGKFIGFLIGYHFAGVFGALFGLFIGHLIDVWRTVPRGAWATFSQHHRAPQEMQEVFLNTAFRTMGHLAKTDGQVSESALQAARTVMTHMRLNEQQRLQAMQYFNEGKAPDFALDGTLSQFLHTSQRNPFLLRSWVDMQWQAAQLTGAISAAKRQRLLHICQRLGYMPFAFYFEQSFQDYFQSAQSRQYQHASYTSRDQLAQAYHVLGVSPQASAAEVKRAYRRLMSKHHPDKLIAQGASEAMVKMATEKAQEIQIAYDYIQKVTGKNQ